MWRLARDVLLVCMYLLAFRSSFKRKGSPSLRTWDVPNASCLQGVLPGMEHPPTNVRWQNKENAPGELQKRKKPRRHFSKLVGSPCLELNQSSVARPWALFPAWASTTATMPLAGARPPQAGAAAASSRTSPSPSSLSLLWRWRSLWQ